MEEQEIQPLRKELESLSVKDLFFKYIRFLPLFVLSIALSLLVAYVFLRYSTPVYRSVGSLIIDNEKASGTNDRFDLALGSDGGKNIQNEIEVLKSRPLMERVVNSLHLNFFYYAKGKVKDRDLYKSSPFYLEAFSIADSSGSFALKIDVLDDAHFKINNEGPAIGFGQVFKNAYGVFRLVRKDSESLSSEYTITWSSTFHLATLLSSKVVVAPKTQGMSILLISLEATNPQFAADVINQIIDEYQKFTLEQKNLTNQQSRKFIDERLAVISHELDSINQLRIGFMKQNNLLVPEGQQSEYFNRMNEASRSITTQYTQLEVVRMVENYLRDKKNAFDLVPSSLGIQDPTLNVMITAYNAAQLEYKSLLDGNVPRGNVLVQEKEKLIEKLRQNILESLQNVKASYSTAINSFERQGALAQTEMRSLPAKEQVLEDIKRQQAGKLSVLSFLMEKREEIAISLAANIASSRKLEPALPNPSPVKPNAWNIRLLAIVIGLVLPALFIFILELLNDKINSRYDIERLTSAAILGEVGHSFTKNNLVVTANSRSVVAEQFRIIRSNLQYILTRMEKPVILVTSSFSGEGKSFISTNMGAVMGLAGKKTIILEFDIRKPKILSHLNIPKKPGLTNYLLGKIKLEDIPVPVEGSSNLFVFPCGPVPPNPAELLLDSKLDEVFSYLRQHFDVIIMDTAPVGIVSDAMTLGKFADCSLYIVRRGYTYKKQIGLIDEFYREKKLPRAAIVLNDVNAGTGYGYGGYGKYGYGYGTGYFDDENAVPDMWGKWFGWLPGSKWKKIKKRKGTNV